MGAIDAHFYAVIVQLEYLINNHNRLQGQYQRMFDTYEHGYKKFVKVYIFVLRYSIARYQFCVSASSTVARTRILVVGNLLFSNVNTVVVLSLKTNVHTVQPIFSFV